MAVVEGTRGHELVRPTIPARPPWKVIAYVMLNCVPVASTVTKPGMGFGMP